MPPAAAVPSSGRRPLVVYVDHCARLSGAEIALARLLPNLKPAVEVHVVLAEDGPLLGRLRETGVSVEVLAMDAALRDASRSAIGAGRDSARHVLLTLRYAARLRRRLRQLQPDLLHTNSLKAAVYGGLAGRAARVPVVWHMRDRIADDYLPAPVVHLVRGLARVLPTAILCNSKATLQTLPTSSASAVVYNAVVPDSASGRPASSSALGGGPLMFGVVGRLADWKGQHVFLEAFARAFRDTDHRARLVGSAMFGEEAYEQGLHDQIQRLGLTDQVELVGFRTDVEAEYGALHVLVHCSILPEPFGQVVVEGMAAGLAVIASAAGGPLEIIASEVDGLLVPPDDPDALATAMRRLETDRDLLRRLGLQAAVSARRFSPAITAEGVLAVYREVLMRKSHARDLEVCGGRADQHQARSTTRPSARVQAWLRRKMGTAIGR